MISVDRVWLEVGRQAGLLRRQTGALDVRARVPLTLVEELLVEHVTSVPVERTVWLDRHVVVYDKHPKRREVLLKCVRTIDVHSLVVERGGLRKIDTIFGKLVPVAQFLQWVAPGAEVDVGAVAKCDEALLKDEIGRHREYAYQTLCSVDRASIRVVDAADNMLMEMERRWSEAGVSWVVKHFDGRTRYQSWRKE